MEPVRTRRRILLGLLLVAHFASNLGMLLVVSYLHDPIHPLLLFLGIALHGITTSQPVLLAMWAVFGREHLALRAVLPVLILALITVDPIVILPRASHRLMWDALPTYWGYQTALFATCGALFLLMRAYLDWRIVPREAEYGAVVPLGGSKLALGDLFGLTAFCALGLSAMRVYGTYMSAITWPLAKDSLHAVVALVFLPLCLVDKRPLHMYRWMIAAMAVDLIISAALAYRGSNLFLFLFTWLEFSIGFFGSVAFSLWVARAAGYRLGRTSRRQESPGQAGG